MNKERIFIYNMDANGEMILKEVQDIPDNAINVYIEDPDLIAYLCEIIKK